MSETNPYESPKAECRETIKSDILDGRPKSTNTFGDLLRLLAFGAIVGASLATFACGVLSGGNTAGRFYLIYGCLGAVIGVFGSILGIVPIAMMRFAHRIASKCTTSPSRKGASDHQRDTDSPHVPPDEED
jgi:hypothetical protein